MRPVSLHVQGFTAFRSPVDIDFAGADLFALTGPTGSGKSSIIDAICFALYGSVPRLSGVAPVISLGKPEARIRLVFEVDGEHYTVSRLIARQGDGATQRDVRLEGGGIAVEGVREVDSRIAGLLGLTFDHFTRTVVLPQGRFAAFLEDGPAAREKLLKQLLDLGVYEEMRKRGAGQAARLEGEIGAVDAQLHDLLVDADQVAATEATLDRLRTLSEKVVAAVAAQAEVASALSEQRQGRDRVVSDIDRLGTVAAPRGLSEMGDRLERARAAAEEAGEVLASLDGKLASLTAERELLGEVAALTQVIDAYRKASELADRIANGSALVDDALTRQAAAHKDMVEAETAVASAESALAALERSHAAHAIRTGLAVGDECPVCLRSIEALPSTSAPAGIDEAKKRLDDARASRHAAGAAQSSVDAEVARLAGLLDERRAEHTAAVEALSDAPGLDDVVTNQQRAEALDAEIGATRARAAGARTAAHKATLEMADAQRAAASASESLDRIRDTLAGLEPPAPTRVDPVRDWTALLAWRDTTRADLETRRADLTEAITRHEGRVAEIRAEMDAAGRDAGVTDLGADPKVVIATAIATAEANLMRLRADLEKRHTLELRRKTLDSERGRYDETAKLLRSNRFQQWLIEEALVGLVDLANAELSKLAGGAYSLAVDGGEFEVIDHRNAEARRSVKTLSGGETFLVSLALALALAERVVATSAIGTARIESMFLDEGFGTLDAETLDTVASVVQELGSRERMIGLVTHVRELADQIPVRFEVRKLPEGSTVTRVES
jgi:exonuclease SbcC